MSQSFEKLFVEILSRFDKGQLTLKLPSGTEHFFGDAQSDQKAHIQVNDELFFKRVIIGSDIGMGESYMENLWSTDDLTAVLKVFILNRPHIQKISKNPFIIGRIIFYLLGERIQHKGRSNSKDQSRKNIHAHYDLGNEFYREFLDPGMTYSAAYFEHPNQDLESAQNEKYDRLCRKLNLKPGLHLLEIGSGWGGFAIHAASNYGCRVTTVTISERQYTYAKNRIKQAGLEDLIEIRIQDYRDIRGQFDRIASIEMLEAVGHEHLDSYFGQCSNLLKPDGILGIQVILSPDSRYQYYRKRVDFIRKHIFPGGHLPSFQSIHNTVKQHSDWDIQHVDTFGAHYAETLRRWQRTFNDTKKQRRNLGFDDVFDRKWNFYFSFCEAGFDMRLIQVAQLIYSSPQNTNYQFESDWKVYNRENKNSAQYKSL